MNKALNCVTTGRFEMYKISTIKIFRFPLCTIVIVSGIGLYWGYGLTRKLRNGMGKRRIAESKSNSGDMNVIRIPIAKAPKYSNPWYRYLDRSCQFWKQPNRITWNNVLFFPEINPEEPGSQTQQLIWYLQQAKVTLKMAMYSCNFKPLEKVLFDLVKKGVKVTAVTNTNKNRWRKRGVGVREKPKTLINPLTGTFLDHMHHKFIVIDEKAIMTGSLNWTTFAVMKNRESVVITDNPKIVKMYAKEFATLWELSHPRLRESPSAIDTFICPLLNVERIAL